VKKHREKKGALGEKSAFMAGEKPVFIKKFLGGDLIEQIPSELERLKKKALNLETEQAKPAAQELLKRAIEVMQHLGPVLMDRPDLLRDDVVKRFEMPVLMALHRGHRYYYKRVLNKLRALKLGSKTGIACRERANWKSTGDTGGLAVTLYNTVKALRTNSSLQADNVTKAFVLYIRKYHPAIATAAAGLPEFGAGSVDKWIEKGCSPVLYALMPKLQPMTRGKRKRTDLERADPRAKRQRDAIVQRIRAMAAGPDKRHTRVKQSN
jgi:hypothetical protein